MTEHAYLEFASYEEASAFVDALNAEARAGAKLPPGMRHSPGKLPRGGFGRWSGVLYRCSAGRLHAYGARAVAQGERTVLQLRVSPNAQPSYKAFTIIGGVIWLVVFGAIFYLPLLGDMLLHPSLPKLVTFVFLSFMVLAAIYGLLTTPRFFAALCAAPHGFKELYARHRQFVARQR